MSPRSIREAQRRGAAKASRISTNVFVQAPFPSPLHVYVISISAGYPPVASLNSPRCYRSVSCLAVRFRYRACVGRTDFLNDAPARWRYRAINIFSPWGGGRGATLCKSLGREVLTGCRWNLAGGLCVDGDCCSSNEGAP